MSPEHDLQCRWKTPQEDECKYIHTWLSHIYLSSVCQLYIENITSAITSAISLLPPPPEAADILSFEKF